MSEETVDDRGDTTSFIETLITPCYNVCTIINSCLNTDCCCVCTFQKCRNGKRCCCTCSRNRNIKKCLFHECFLKWVLYMFDFMCCLIPICPFIFYYDCCNCCSCCTFMDDRSCKCCNCFDCCCCNCCECCNGCKYNYFFRGALIALNLLIWLFVSFAVFFTPNYFNLHLFDPILYILFLCSTTNKGAFNALRSDRYYNNSLLFKLLARSHQYE